jgi:Fuc2NAc and GlcNAc transferase
MAGPKKSSEVRDCLLTQMIAVAIVLFLGITLDEIAIPVVGYVDLGIFGYVISFFWILGLIPQPLIVLAAASSGFLVINWPQARVFIGDIGSGFLGLVFGVFIVTQTMLPLWSWLILLGWFITDATVTITVRLFRGETISEAHSQHLYQHLNRAVGSQRTLFGLVLINTCWLFPLAFAASIFQELGAVLLGLAYLPIIIFQYYCGAGQPTSKFMARETK